MTAGDIHSHINELIATEKSLRKQLAAGEITVTEEHQRLRQVEQELDQLWDLLRQRHAQREFGQDPAKAAERSVTTVEDYRG